MAITYINVLIVEFDISIFANQGCTHIIAWGAVETSENDHAIKANVYTLLRTVEEVSPLFQVIPSVVQNFEYFNAEHNICINLFTVLLQHS